MESPALKAFEFNPFRLLRTATSATTTQASFEAEQLLTLARMDIAPPVPDPLPWLPSPGIPELQQAAQSIEEPLLRLKHQLLWFDFELDPDGPALAAALHDRDRAALQAYLDIAQPPLSDADAVDGTDTGVAIAQGINRANLMLLMASAIAGGVWTDPASGRDQADGFRAEQWQALGAFRKLPNAHLVVSDARAGDIDEAGAFWRSGLSGWMTVLADPRFRGYVVGKINALEDDYADPDDADAIEDSIRTYLADLSGQEIRFALMGGHDRLAAALTAAVAQADLPARLLNPAMRPVRQFLQADLTELEPLLDQADDDRLEPVARFLRLLTLVRDRWLVLDAGGVLGLRALLDQAAERIYLRVRQWSRPGPEADELLKQTSGLVSAKSLKERIASLREQQQERRERICYYCKRNDPDYDKSVVLRGKQETHTTRSFMTKTTHFLIRYTLVTRCARCATLHQLVGRTSLALSLMTVTAVIAVGVAWYHTVQEQDEAKERQWMAEMANRPVPPPAPARSLTAVPPVAHGNGVLTRDELRFCFARTVEIDAWSDELDSIEKTDVHKYNSNIPAFNAAVQDHKDRCISREYYSSDKTRVDSEIADRRAELEALGRANVH